MSNPFSTEKLLKGQGIYAVAKGDLPGHAFHGNQHTSASFSSSKPFLKGATTIGEANDKLNSAVQNGDMSLSWHGEYYPETLDDPEEQPEVLSNFDHVAASNAHNEIANALEKVGTPEALIAATAHREAAVAHDEADKAAGLGTPEDDDKYQLAAETAQGYTERAHDYTVDPTGGKYEPTKDTGWEPIIPGKPQPYSTI